MPTSPVRKLKNTVVRLLPHGLQRQLKKAWYPHVVRNFSLEDWPYGMAARALIDQGDSVADVGANIGYISGLLSRLVGAEGRVYSFEPVPETYGYLTNNLAKLPLQNFQVFQIAASSVGGEAKMEIPHFDGGAQNFYQSHIVADDGVDSSVRHFTVKTERLDTTLGGAANAIVFVKIDVEGHELGVIEGASNLLANSRPAMLIEVAHDPDTSDSNAGQLFARLEAQNYRAYLLRNGLFRERNSGEQAVDYLFLQPGHVERLRQAKLLVENNAQTREPTASQ